MNWLQPPDEPAEGVALPAIEENDGPEESTLNYWAHRLMPLHDPAPAFASRPDEPNEVRAGSKEVIFVACNRVGLEEGESLDLWSKTGPLMGLNNASTLRDDLCRHLLRHDLLVQSFPDRAD